MENFSNCRGLQTIFLKSLQVKVSKKNELGNQKESSRYTCLQVQSHRPGAGRGWDDYRKMHRALAKDPCARLGSERLHLSQDPTISALWTCPNY